MHLMAAAGPPWAQTKLFSWLFIKQTGKLTVTAHLFWCCAAVGVRSQEGWKGGEGKKREREIHWRHFDPPEIWLCRFRGTIYVQGERDRVVRGPLCPNPVSVEHWNTLITKRNQTAPSALLSLSLSLHVSVSLSACLFLSRACGPSGVTAQQVRPRHSSLPHGPGG